MGKYNDPVIRMVVAAGAASDPQHFWNAVVSLLRESHGAAWVQIEYADGFAAGSVAVGTNPDGDQLTEQTWDGSGDRYARACLAPTVANPDLLSRELVAATELAALVGRRTMLEYERRIGTFLVEMSHWMRAASSEPRQLLQYAIHAGMSLVAGQGGLVVERADEDTLRITAAVGEGEMCLAVGAIPAHGTFGQVVASEEAVLTDSLADELPLPPDGPVRNRLAGAMLVPLGMTAGSVGVLCNFRVADDPRGREPFSPSDVTYLQALASHIGGALELAQATVAARRAAERLSAMVDGSPLPLALVDPAGNVLEANKAWAILFGLGDAAALTGRNLDAFSVTLDRAAPAEALGLSTSGVPWRGRAEVMRAGEHRKCDAIVTHLGAGEDGDFLVALHDRTDEIRAQRELIAKEKLQTLGTIASGIAHEVNNPLAAIRMEAELLGLGDASAEVSDAVKVIITEVDRAARIAKSLLRLSRQSETRMEQVDIDRLLEGIIEVRGRVLEAEGISLLRIAEPDLPTVLARPGDLERLFLHLVQNAEHAVRGRPNATIEVSSVRVADGVHVTVDDSGPGVDPDYRARVFDPFFTTRAPDKGRGLGLAMSQRIVSELGGKIWVDTGPLDGARFVVEFPAAST